MEWIVHVDESVLHLIRDVWRHPALDAVFELIARARHVLWVLIAGVVGLLVLAPARWRYFILMIAVSIGMADMLSGDLKVVVKRARPPRELRPDAAARSTPGRKSTTSFPSSHAANAFAAATFLAWLLRRRRWLAACVLVCAAAIGYSRIYQGVHYPSDVAGGAALGVLCAAVILVIHRRMPPVSFAEDGRSRVSWAGLLAIFVLFAAVYLYSWVLRTDIPLAPEEAQYWDWSRRLDWSYYSKPPLIAFLIRCFTTVFGSNPFGIRATAVSLSVAMMGITCVLVHRIYRSERITFFAVLMLFFLPLYSIGAVVITTDTPLMFFWSACCLFLYLALMEEKRWAWYPAGLCLGLGLLSKYAMVYLLVCVAVIFLLVRRASARSHGGGQGETLSPRNPYVWLGRKEPYVFLLIGAACVAPVVYWNASHDWVAFKHVAALTRVDRGLRLDIKSLLRYLVEQPAVVSPLLFLVMVWVAVRMLFREGGRAPANDRFLLAMGLPVYLMLLLKSIQGKVLGNWAAPAYYTWTILAVARFDRYWQAIPERRSRRRVLAYASAALLLPAAFFVFLHEPGMFRSIARGTLAAGVQLPRGADPAYKLVGYDEMGHWVSERYTPMARGRPTFLFTEQYQVAAEMAFYVEGQPRAYTVNIGRRRMTQYDVWGPPGEAEKGWNAVFVMRGYAEHLAPQIAENFESIAAPEHLTIRRRGIPYRHFTLFQCFQFDGRFDGARRPDRY